MRVDLSHYPGLACAAQALPALLPTIVLSALLGACERPPDKPPVPKVERAGAASLSTVGFPAARLVPGMEPGAAEKKPDRQLHARPARAAPPAGQYALQLGSLRPAPEARRQMNEPVTMCVFVSYKLRLY